MIWQKITKYRKSRLYFLLAILFDSVDKDITGQNITMFVYEITYSCFPYFGFEIR